MSFLESFGVSFLDTLGQGIDERKTKAEEYEEQRREMAERNAPLIRRRKLLSQNAAIQGNQAISLGAQPYQVQAAMSAGVGGMENFLKKLQSVANEKGVRKLSKDDIDGLMNLPTLPSVNDKYIDISLEEFANRTYGVSPNEVMELEDTGATLGIKNLLRLNDKAKVRNKLKQEQYAGGMSIAQINEAASQADYDSLFPSLGMTLLDVEYYSATEAGEFIKDITSASARVKPEAAESAASNALIAEQQKAAEEGRTISPEEGNAFKAAFKKELIKDQVKPIIESNIGRFGRGGFFDNQTSVDIVTKIMGEDYVNTQRSLYGKDEEEEVEENLVDETQGSFEAIKLGMDEFENRLKPADKIADSEFEESTEAEAPNTEAKKEALLAKTFPTRKSQRGLASKGTWDRKYEGKVDPETGRVIIAPPRPPAGGEKTKEIPIRVGLLGSRTGKKRKVTEAEYWDITYGETHDVNGIPKGL